MKSSICILIHIKRHWQIDYESNVARQGLEPRHRPAVNPKSL